MSDSSLIKLKKYLKDRDYDFITDVKIASEEDVDYFLFVSADSIADKSKNSEITSYYQMMRIKSQIKKSFDLAIKWIVKKGDKNKSLVESVETLIKNKYNESIKHVAISPIKYEPVWIYIEKNESSKLNIRKDEILEDLKPIFSIYGIKELKISFQNIQESFPANPVILLCIKIYAPISLKEISSKLINKGYHGATIDRVKSKIETLRTYGLIVWAKNDIYSLSLNAQQSFSYVNPKNSPDVLRALELGRKKWHNNE